MNTQLVFGTLGAAIGFFTANAIIGVSVGIAMALGFNGTLGRIWRSIASGAGS